MYATASDGPLPHFNSLQLPPPAPSFSHTFLPHPPQGLGKTVSTISLMLLHGRAGPSAASDAAVVDAAAAAVRAASAAAAVEGPVEAATTVGEQVQQHQLGGSRGDELGGECAMEEVCGIMVCELMPFALLCSQISPPLPLPPSLLRRTVGKARNNQLGETQVPLALCLTEFREGKAAEGDRCLPLPPQHRGEEGGRSALPPPSIQQGIWSSAPHLFCIR